MATLNAGLPTLLDVVQRLAPNGAIARIVETMQQATPLLQDMVWKEGNLPTGHLITKRTALPALTWRRMNEGIAPSKSQTGQVTETCGMLEGISKVDCALAKLNGNEAAFRASEDMAYFQSFNRELETAFFYHSTRTDAAKIMGLTPRLDALSGLEYQSQVINMATDITPTDADQNSIWIVGWGPNSVYGITPKGSVGGLEVEDLGKELTKDSGGTNEFLAYRTHFKWSVGLAVEDARYLVRIPNLDSSVLAAGTGKTLIKALAKGLEQMQDLESVRPVIYMNRKLRTLLRLQAQDTTQNSTLTWENVGGKPMLSFSGVPIRRTDALLSTEAIVT